MNSVALELLRELATALDGAFISSWQSTAKWQKELDAALEFLRETDEQAAPKENDR